MEYGVVINKLGELQERFEHGLLARNGERLADRNDPPYLIGRIFDEVNECKADVVLQRVEAAITEADDIVIFYSSLISKMFIDEVMKMQHDLSWYEQETGWMKDMLISPIIYLHSIEMSMQSAADSLRHGNIDEAQHTLLFAGAIVKQLFFSLGVPDAVSILVSARDKQVINEMKYTPDILIRAQTVSQGMSVCKDVWNILVEEYGSPEMVVFSLQVKDEKVVARREELIVRFLTQVEPPKSPRQTSRKHLHPGLQPQPGIQQAV